MKKLIALLLALVMVLGLVACGAKTENPQGSEAPHASQGAETPAEEKTIAVVAKGETHAFWQAVKAGAVDAGKKAGYNVTFRGPTAESEEYVGSQREMVQAALNNKTTKAIVLATIGLGFADELTAAYDKGIPVVEFDSGLYSGGADITEGKDPTIGSVATDNKAAAAVVAENFYAYLKAQKVLANGYKIGIIQHDSTSTGIDRAGGFKEKIEALAKADSITLDINVQVKANNAGEYKLGLTALKEWGAQSIFMTNEGVVNEVFPEISDNAATYKEILFCGFDAGTNQYDWMKDAGAKYALLVGSVAQDSYNIGYKSVELAIAKLEGKEVSDVGIAGVWYNKDNIDEQKDKNIFYMG
ncbi:MAG: substrate-binding domain-containing protein [Oscillospiraceae bacterium]|nr:substrate-binding domain-containing protein [Oscillospiraceae bacterium]